MRGACNNRQQDKFMQYFATVINQPKGQKFKTAQIQWTLDRRVHNYIPQCWQIQTYWNSGTFCGSLPSIKIRKAKMFPDKRYIVSEQDCLFKVDQTESLFSRENEIRSSLWPHFTAHQKKTASTAIIGTQQSVLHNELQVCDAILKCREKKTRLTRAEMLKNKQMRCSREAQRLCDWWLAGGL